MVEKRKHIVVIGGGAAGVFGAIACAEADLKVNRGEHSNFKVTILEAGLHPLSKVKISGGGRCNVTHSCFDPMELITHYPRGHRELRGLFYQFQPKDTVAWFEQRGVRLKTEEDGRIFPITDQSQTIINCLLDSVSRHPIILRTRAAVRSVMAKPETVSGFEVQLKSGERILCDRVLLATGSHSSGYRIAQSLGHHLQSPVPSLFTFTLSNPELLALAGIAIDPVRVRLILPEAKALEQVGPLLITHWGMSGPAVLKLSAWGARELYNCRYQARLRVTWLPNDTQESLRQCLLRAKQEWAKKAIASISPVNVPRRFWRYLLSRSQLDTSLRWADLSKKGLSRLVQVLLQDEYRIQNKGVFKDEFVTCGGIPLKEVNFKTMESRCCPGLFLAGELLDIDGVTGGFNFQNAWTTGWVAGQSLAQ